MAIDLPPIIPPQASTAEKIENYAALNSADVIEREVAGYTLRITGNKYLSDEQVDTIMSAVQTPAQAVNALNNAYYQLGHLLVTVYFAHRDNLIFAHVVNGKLSAIKAPEKISGYFEPLVGDEDLTRAEFDERRVLADIDAKRHGVDYTMSYQLEADPEAFTLVFTGKENEDDDSTTVTAGLNNLGNRFLGRYFANLGLTHDFSNGVEFTFNYDRAITQWGETNGGDYYNGYSVKLDSPTRWGLYGAEGRYVEYARDVALEVPVSDPGQSGGAGSGPLGDCLLLLPGLCDGLNEVLGILLPGEEGTNDDGTVTTQRVLVGLESETYSVALTGEQIIASDSYYRLTVSQRLEASENTIEIDGLGTLLDEPHSTAEVGLKYNRILRLAGVPTQIVAQGFAVAGLSSDSGTLGTDDNAGAVAIGRRSAEFLLLKPRFTAKVSVLDWASLNLQTIAQFSDDTQLPLQQQFVLGGSSLSAYLPGVLIGDSGSYTKLSFSANGLPALGMTLKPAIFLEHGQAWFEDASGEAGQTRQIVDAGVSLSASWGDILTTDLVAAVPVDDRNIDDEQLEQSEVDFYWNVKLAF